MGAPIKQVGAKALQAEQLANRAGVKEFFGFAEGFAKPALVIKG